MHAQNNLIGTAWLDGVTGALDALYASMTEERWRAPEKLLIRSQSLHLTPTYATMAHCWYTRNLTPCTRALHASPRLDVPLTVRCRAR